MAFKPTATQQKAIEATGNVLVSAAAGSGKTAVLVERVINKLLDKNSSVSADRLLIVTFTNAAAAEMRERIEKRLYEEIQKIPTMFHCSGKNTLFHLPIYARLTLFALNLCVKILKNAA